MGVVIGSLTQVIIDSVSEGYQSISWSIQVQPNRLWQLGSWDPYKTQVSTVVSVNVTSYAGALNQITLSPSTSCVDSNANRDVYIHSAACGPTSEITVDYNNVFITSYSYSKTDPTSFGTESWSMQKWIATTNLGAEFIDYPAPTYVLQGIAEGSRQGNVGNGTSDLGVIFETDGQVTGSQGNVSAGFPGLGRADDITYGLITHVGGGLLESTGKDGQSSATIPHQPLYLG
jgi:hypothetical protein